MAQKNKMRNASENLLDQLGIRGSFTDLVRKAVIQGWDMDEFAQALSRTKQFRKAFPGLVDFKTKTVSVDFGGGSGSSSLLQAVNRYRQGFDDFQEIANRVGYPGQVNKRVFGMAVRQGISPDEFAQRVTIGTALKNNPDLLDLYNEQRKFSGLKRLDKIGFMKGLAKNDPDVVDAYQAAYLRNAGLDLTREQAANTAKGIDSPLQPNMDLGRLVSEINRIKPDIGPELRAAGIGDDQLALLASGQDPNNLASKLEQLIANRRIMQRGAQGAQSRNSSTGGLSIFPEDQATSY